MKIISLFFLLICTFSTVKNENTTEIPITTTTTDELITTDIPLAENVTQSAFNETAEDKPIALPLLSQRLRRGPPVTIYKHRVRVSRRRPKPRRRFKGPRPIYGPPKHRPPPSPSFHKPSHPESHESSDIYSYSTSYDKPSHSSLDVSSDFNIQSIPAVDYGGSKESYEFHHADSYDDEVIPFDPDSFSYPKPTEKKKSKKHHRIKSTPQKYEVPSHHSEETLSFSYEAPVKSIEYDLNKYGDEIPSYSYVPKTKPSSKHHKPSTSYSHSTPSKSYDSISFPPLSKSKGYSYEPPVDLHSKTEPGYSYEPAGKSHEVQHDIPELSYSPLPEYLDSHTSSYERKPSIKPHSKPPKNTGYSYEPPASSYEKDDDQTGYKYTPPKLPYKPHETYGPPPPPPKPPSSSYGYPVFSAGHTPSIEDIHGPSKDYGIPDIPHKPKFSHNPSPPGSLYDLPSRSSSGEVFGKHPTSDYHPPDSTYSFTTKTNTYNSLPTDRPKSVPGHFAEPPPDYKPDFSKNGLSTSHFPLDQDHLSSNYGSPKSSYEVPIYDAVPFTTPSLDFYPPNLPTSYNENGFENVARGSHKFEVSAPNNRPTRPILNREKEQINNLPALGGSLEDHSDPSEELLDEIIETQKRKKRRGKPKRTRGGTKRNRRPIDLDGAFSSHDEVKVYPSGAVAHSTISTVLNNTSDYSNWTPMKPNNEGQLIRHTVERAPSNDVVSIEKSLSHSFYDGTMPPDVLHPPSDRRKHVSGDISEINLQSPEIYVSNKKKPHLEVTRRGSVFDETLNYWEKHPLPPNHKLN